MDSPLYYHSASMEQDEEGAITAITLKFTTEDGSEVELELKDKEPVDLSFSDK